MSEQKRGCGYRKIGGLYLVCDPGEALVCDGLPLPLEPCGCCGFTPAFSRNLQSLNPEYISQAEKKLHDEKPYNGGDPYALNCSCPDMCPICHTEAQVIQGNSLGLMFVGKQYTPSSFIKEAVQLGISKRIPEISSWLKLGETWVFLAHNQVPKVSLEQLKENGLQMKEPEYQRAIFYGFKPKRLEMPVWKGDLCQDEITLLVKHGITPVFLDPIPENKKLHKNAKVAIKWLLKRWLEGKTEEEE